MIQLLIPLLSCSTSYYVKVCWVCPYFTDLCLNPYDKKSHSLNIVMFYIISYVTDVWLVYTTQMPHSTRYEFHFGLKGQVTIIC